MEFIIYFLGPFLLGVSLAARLRQRFRVFVIGLVAFFLAWVPMQTIATVAGRSDTVAASPLLTSVIVAACAGVFEELARYVAFRRCAAFRGNHNWRSTLVYAIGHHGMETILVGFNLAMVYLVFQYKPGAIAEATLWQQCLELLGQGRGARIYGAFERLSVGLLLQVCFSSVVMLAVARGRRCWLLAAITWHFVHDLVGLNLHWLPYDALVSKAWLAFIVVGYSYAVVRLYRALEPAGAVARVPANTGGRPPMILPGRLT